MLHFYKAELVDAAAISALINHCFRGEVSRQGWTTEADIVAGKRTTSSEVASVIKRPDAFVLMGVLDDEIVATVCCDKQMIAGKQTAHFGKVSVKPNLQNKGYGKDLIHAAEAMTKREWRVLGFHMSVISLRTELIAYYERLGYERTGELEAFPENPDLWQPKVEGLTLAYLVKLT